MDVKLPTFTAIEAVGTIRVIVRSWDASVE